MNTRIDTDILPSPYFKADESEVAALERRFNWEWLLKLGRSKPSANAEPVFLAHNDARHADGPHAAGPEGVLSSSHPVAPNADQRGAQVAASPGTQAATPSTPAARGKAATHFKNHGPTYAMGGMITTLAGGIMGIGVWSDRLDCKDLAKSAREEEAEIRKCDGLVDAGSPPSAI